MPEISYADLSDPVPVEERPWLDAELEYEDLTPFEYQWRSDGFVILPGVIPDVLVDAYCERFIADDVDPATGYGIGTPYMAVDEIKDVCLHPTVTTTLARLIGEPMGMHLNLTGWQSTERDWHADAYLNPPEVGTWYAAAWFALGEIDHRSGPFEFVPGSHRWPLLRREKVIAAGGLDASDPDWPRHSERLLTPLYERMIEEQGLLPVQFLGEKGDVLIWHAGLLHRGSKPHVPGMERRAIIAHYSGVNHRPDMATPRLWITPAFPDTSSRYFPF